ncbi:2-oxo-4-hydroxy-4-carboxy-5-ureidoimidazoline decarboxylase [Kocuria sp. JC486]|uniref:2-oxo-4-hydroxy-4-carboxy-5-ureidoimidazoline decarboxylase n=1 Tax=Kocuria sp. JC486 TaxID=1970736 RepID=UPI00142263C9|nr:2-oxo-4-hydroxy-4-carboxy-5-ureidoimidazoline decarboxylase [Kocuria sp. JC486]NHU86043.1 2-oxo-4-hydroxy-4-carboxy-5-ureidoimidazoline decarboxylase [Kocuria sp. JC486]
MDLRTFNSADEAAARQVLKACADVPRWISGLLAQRPFPSAEHLYGRALSLAESWSADEVGAAVAGHPRIGSRRLASSSGPESMAFSADEQSGMSREDRAAWAEANRVYEQKFNQIFLIRAAGRSSTEMLQELERRLTNDPATESSVRATQLRQIMLLRLQKSVTATQADGAGAGGELTARQRSFVTTHVLDTTVGSPASGITVHLFGPDGERLGQGVTDPEGRINHLGPSALAGGVHRLVFDVQDYWRHRDTPSFFTKVDLAFAVEEGQSHYHVPLLISPWSFSSYRGS